MKTIKLTQKKSNSEAQKRYRNKNHEKVRKSAREWAKKNRQLNPDTCHIVDRKSALKKNYGITIKQYDILFAKQNGVCAICHKPEGVSKYLCVDHNHNSGKVRGLLCRKCNLALGHIDDSILILEEMIKYLKKYEIY